MRILIYFCFLLFANGLFAQVCAPKNRTEKRQLKRINKLISENSYYNAIDALSKVEVKPIFLELRSEIEWINANYFKSEKFALDCITVCPDNFPNAFYFLGQINFYRNNFVKANFYLQQAINLEISDPYYSDAIRLYNKAKYIAEIINNPVDFEPEVVKNLSTDNDEYLPIISPDQELAFFTRRSNVKSLNSITTSIVENFIMSKKVGEKFEIGNPLGFPFNQSNNEGGASLTIDNKILYFTKCVKNKKGYNNCDIYYVYLYNDSTYSEIQSFPQYISKKDSWESQPTVSSDGNTIFFSSDRKGGFGKMDLYEINKVNGKWSKPVNLGPNINSSQSEKSPYLHTDGKTLFFSSTNFPSIGGFDIFYSRKDSLGFWNKPLNIGYPINTVSDEISLFVSTDGEKAYFASNNIEDSGGWNIYSFDLHKSAKPQRVLFLKGDIFGDNINLDNVELEIKNINTKDKSIVSLSSGSYVVAIPIGDDDDVILTIKEEGIAFKSKFISSKDTTFTSPKKISFNLESLEEGSSFKVENIYFDTDSYHINDITKEVLIEFSEFLKLNKKLIIEINGFTDNVGDMLSNEILSKNRAKAVVEILLSKGVDRSRVSFNGYGEKKPIADNMTKKGRSKNRRTEFRVLSK
jgi:outer membrane protein OmpA-like peptidoglycan-associated protein/tetratricopeptide (TPR) repeat protein